jgi:hypothetical protein
MVKPHDIESSEKSTSALTLGSDFETNFRRADGTTFLTRASEKILQANCRFDSGLSPHFSYGECWQVAATRH